MQVVKLADEADVRSQIRGKEYEDALMLGPAVLALFGSVRMLDCQWDGDAENIFIEVPEGSTLLGVVGVTDTSFHRCRFQNVAVIGTSDQREVFAGGFMARSEGDQPSAG